MASIYGPARARQRLSVARTVRCSTSSWTCDPIRRRSCDGSPLSYATTPAGRSTSRPVVRMDFRRSPGLRTSPIGSTARMTLPRMWQSLSTTRSSGFLGRSLQRCSPSVTTQHCRYPLLLEIGWARTPDGDRDHCSIAWRTAVAGLARVGVGGATSHAASRAPFSQCGPGNTGFLALLTWRGCGYAILPPRVGGV